MASFVNQHSFLLAAGAAVVLLAAVLLHDGVRPADLLALGGLCLGLALAYALAAPGASSAPDAASVRARLGAGKPVLLEFQSPY
jgi:hypothetical protein